jgi:hypothetical protein
VQYAALLRIPSPSRGLATWQVFGSPSQGWFPLGLPGCRAVFKKFGWSGGKDWSLTELPDFSLTLWWQPGNTHLLFLWLFLPHFEKRGQCCWLSRCPALPTLWPLNTVTTTWSLFQRSFLTRRGSQLCGGCGASPWSVVWDPSVSQGILSLRDIPS